MGGGVKVATKKTNMDFLTRLSQQRDTWSLAHGAVSFYT